LASADAFMHILDALYIPRLSNQYTSIKIKALHLCGFSAHNRCYCKEPSSF